MNNETTEYKSLDGQYATPGIEVKGIGAIVDDTMSELDLVTETNKRKAEAFLSTLAGHIKSTYQINKAARSESGLDEEMINSLYQVNMEYRPNDLARMRTGSKIYMGLTATKSRAARSWIKDILQPAKGVPFAIRQTPSVDLDPEILKQIEDAFSVDAERLSMEIEKEFNELAQTGGESQTPGALVASKKIKRISALRCDIEDALQSEVDRIAKHDVSRIELGVIDELTEGDWEKEFSDFIEDFTIFPTAFMKGPIVSTKVKLVWENGIAVPKRQVVFTNKRVSPLDAYPSPSASDIYKGDFIEHIRLTKKDLSDLSFLGKDTGYKKSSIVDILNNIQPGDSGLWIDSQIEEEKQHAERRGSQGYAGEGIYHGVHFWGTVPIRMLIDWGYSESDLGEYEPHEEVEIEAIMVGLTVIKCLINRDPLGRRPYYSASFQTRSGSIWGNSLPYLMRDIQRMCNACARSLADNMGLSSGPQVSILVDRLADGGSIEEMAPRMIHQFTSDPAGNGGRPIEFFVVPSNAKELLAVYDKFEIKADDVTGVPRYAYGNESVGGAAQTASGLSMLLESATKGIKSSIKNISEGVIVPRVNYQFYLHLLNKMEEGNTIGFSGDINVVVHAAEAITIKATEAQLQKELLNAVMNEQGMSVVGLQGYGEILRTVFKGVNLPEDAIPSRLELKEREAQSKFEQASAAKAQADQVNQKGSIGLEATKIQADAQIKMHQGTQETKNKEIELRAKAKSTDQQLRAVEIEQRVKTEAGKLATKLDDTERKLTAEAENIDRKLATQIVTSH
jgi:hypothetical protein